MGVVSLAKGGIVNAQKYSSMAAGSPLYVATLTGGVLSSDSNYYYRTFKANGTLSISGGAVNADILIIAGGGGAGFTAGGGGGAGGVVYASSKSLAIGSYPIVIGTGGAGGQTDGTAGTPGTDSSFFGFTAFGGGRGIHNSDGSSTAGGSSGGVGYGTTDSVASAATQTSPVGATGYGFKGGDNINGGTSPYTSAGGGGAGGVGANVIDVNNGGAGGVGLNTWESWATATFTGVSGYYAGGGGGSAGNTQVSTAGGLGGGGTGGYAFGSAATNGVANTGGGGGGGSHTGGTSGGGSSGGSGVVIVRYPKSTVIPIEPWRADANSAYLKIATPFNSDLGISDYSANIIGSGTSKTTSSVNGAALSTAVYKYYNSSLAMGAYTDNKFISIPRSTDLQIGSNDFTIEGWYYFTSNSVGYQALASHCGDSADQQPGWIFILESNNTLSFYSATSAGGWSNNIGTSIVPTTNTWHHVAVSRSGTSLRMFLNGTQIGTTTTSTGVIGLPSSRELRIGSYNYFPGGTRGMNGYIQDFRMYIGVAKYTSTFTPPSSIYTGG